MNYPLIAKIVLVSVALGVGFSTTHILRMKKNNAIEQAAESVIKDQTGIIIDFSTDDEE